MVSYNLADEELRAMSEAFKLKQRQIANLRAEKAHITNVTSSPIISVPTEILGLIFEQADYTRFALSHVCSRFRTVAIGLPSLWTTIVVSSYLPLKALETYLQRSQECLLAITIDISQTDGKSWDFDLVWQELYKHIARWRHLHIAADTHPTLHLYPFLEHIQYLVAPMLEDFQISLQDTDGMDSAEYTHDYAPQTFLRGGAPRLSSVRLWGIGAMNYWPPCSGITSLFIDKALPETVWDYVGFRDIFLPSFPSLTVLSLAGYMFHVPFALTDPPLVLPKVRFLRLIFHDDWEDPSGFIRLLSAPMMESLTFANLEMWGIYGEFNAARFPKLCSLTVFPGCCLKTSLYSILSQAFPDITHFASITDARTVLAHLSALPMHWKKLQRLDLWTTSDVVSWLLIPSTEKMLASRRAAGCPIAVLSLKPFRSGHAWKTIQKLVQINPLDCPDMKAWPEWSHNPVEMVGPPDEMFPSTFQRRLTSGWIHWRSHGSPYY